MLPYIPVPSIEQESDEPIDLTRHYDLQEVEAVGRRDIVKKKTTDITHQIVPGGNCDCWRDWNVGLFHHA